MSNIFNRWDLVRATIWVVGMALIASSCGQAPSFTKPVKVPPTVCSINGADIHKQSCCEQPWVPCQE